MVPTVCNRFLAKGDSARSVKMSLFVGQIPRDVRTEDLEVMAEMTGIHKIESESASGPQDTYMVPESEGVKKVEGS